MRTVFELMMAITLTALSIAAVPFAIAYAMIPENRKGPKRLPSPKR
ncbi:MAG: hypothetical protein JEZ02_10450 [Desulfatibacillum sp.]|nr:hypothetical protein [Desulfatibacillum sp.]